MRRDEKYERRGIFFEAISSPSESGLKMTRGAEILEYRERRAARLLP